MCLHTLRIESYHRTVKNGSARGLAYVPPFVVVLGCFDTMYFPKKIGRAKNIRERAIAQRTRQKDEEGHPNRLHSNPPRKKKELSHLTALL